MINNRLTRLFNKKANNVLSLFFTAGFPNLSDTLTIARACENAGVDLIEIGIPFSDSLVDGPTIQASNEIALKNGMTIELLFKQLQNLRDFVQMPIILMGCINPIEQFGLNQFCAKMEEVGIDGALIADLPPEVFENQYKSIFENANISFIPLVTARSSKERIHYLDGLSQGFLYLVSSASVTGGALNTELEAQELSRISSYKLNNPRLMGFGIRDAKTYQSALDFANGAIIGSAFIRVLNEGHANLEQRVLEFVRSIR